MAYQIWYLLYVLGTGQVRYKAFFKVNPGGLDRRKQDHMNKPLEPIRS